VHQLASKPLQMVRVLDFGRVIASAYCGTLLADMGAEVIKVERPGGEFDRKLGPFTENGCAIVYELITPRNKKSITLNYYSPEGSRILDQLVKKVSIIISGFTRKGNEIAGLTYERLKEINPERILVTISGYGQNGPNSNNPAFDAIAQAESGAMSFTGFPDGPPMRAAVPFADFGTAILGAYGAMVALFQKQLTGRGQSVDVSLFDTAFTFVAGMGVIAEYTLLDQIRPRIGNHSFYNFTDSFKAKDGFVVISAIGNKIWRRFAKAINRDDLLKDEKFQNDYDRYQNRFIIRKYVEKWVSKYTVQEVLTALGHARVPCAKVKNPEDLTADEQIMARNMLIDLDYPGIGKIPTPGIPIKLSDMNDTVFYPAPQLGENNEDIYSSLLGKTKSDLKKMRNEGTI
jgi:crotonobetainyl-CoA:carnitine CoA-transferase CaiB-like acyl-CoA transferase